MLGASVERQQVDSRVIYITRRARTSRRGIGAIARSLIIRADADTARHIDQHDTLRAGADVTRHIAASEMT
jgi:hypothetical protein